MQITLWTAEMFTAEETPIYIIPRAPPQAQWKIMSSEPLSTLYWAKMHTHTQTNSSGTRFPGHVYDLFVFSYVWRKLENTQQD